MASPSEQLLREMAMRNACEQQNSLRGLQQGLGQSLGQAGAFGGGVGRAFYNQPSYAPIPEPPKKQTLGLDRGEKAIDYLQRKIDSWLSTVELPFESKAKGEFKLHRPEITRGSWMTVPSREPNNSDDICYRVFGLGSLLFLVSMIWLFSN